MFVIVKGKEVGTDELKSRLSFTGCLRVRS